MEGLNRASAVRPLTSASVQNSLTDRCEGPLPPQRNIGAEKAQPDRHQTLIHRE